MIFTKLSVVLCFVGAAESMNTDSKKFFVGGLYAQKEIGEMIETPIETPYLWDFFPSTSKSNDQTSAIDREIIPEYSADFSTKYRYPDPNTFPKQIAQEISTLESNGKHSGELVSRSARVGGNSRYFGEQDDLRFKTYENLVDGTKFQGFISGNNLMDDENQRFPSELMRPHQHDSLARFKKQRLYDFFPQSSSERMSQLSNTVNQRNEGSFLSDVNFNEGLTQYLNKYSYLRSGSELRAMNQQSMLAQSPTTHEVLNPSSRYITGTNPISHKPGANHKISPVKNIENEVGSSSRLKINCISDDSAPLFFGTSNLQKRKKIINDQPDQTNIAGSSLQKDTKIIEDTNISLNKNSAERRGENGKMEESNIEHINTGGLVDYKLNLYHFYCPSNFKSLGFVFSEEYRDLLSKPTFSYILIEKILGNDKKPLQKLDSICFSAKRFSHPSCNIRLKHVEDYSNEFKSQFDLNELMIFFEKDPRTAPFCEKSITIDDYIDTIFQKLNLGKKKKKKLFKIVEAHKNIQTKTAKERIYRNFSFFCNLINSYITKSKEPIILMKNNDNTNKRLFNEISTKFGLKRVDILGLGGKFILNILDNLKLKFDSKLKKNRAPQSGWCEIALRIIFGVSNKIILFYRIFTPFDEFCIRNLKTNLEYFFKHSERFFTNLFEYFTDNQENLTGKDPYIDQGEKKKYFNFYMNYDKIRFEYDCSKYLFAYWLNYKTTITELDEKMNYAKSPWVINFINDCSIIDFIESYKYPLKDYYWT